MKIVHCVPPVLVLLIAAAWLISLRTTNSALEQDNLALQKKIEQSRSSSARRDERAGAGAESAKVKRERKASENGIRPSDDWVSTSRDWTALVLFNNDAPQDRVWFTAAFKRLESLAAEMNGDELTRTYNEMAALSLHAPFRNHLESVMLKELEKKNPEFAFSQYIVRNQDGGVVLGGYGSFDKWLARDPAAATRWYNSKVAAGTFDKSLDGNSPAMVPFESAFIMSLIGSDPAAAEARINRIPPELRANLGPYMEQVSKENGQAFIDMLRRTMPMDEYLGILRRNSLTDFALCRQIDEDPKVIQKNLESLGITPEERSALLAQQFTELANYSAMRAGGDAPSREQFDSYRKWIEVIDPAAADRATGVALQSYAEKSKTSGALDFIEKYATDYHAAGGGDELLIPLIEGSANGSAFPKDRARGLATKITDAGLRNELLQKLN